MLNTSYISISLCQTLPWCYHFYFHCCSYYSVAVVFLESRLWDGDLYTSRSTNQLNASRSMHDLGQGGFPQLRQLGVVSLQLSLGNQTLAREGEIWVEQHSIHDWYEAEAFRITCTFETSLIPSMTSLLPHPKVFLVILYLLVAFDSSLSNFLNKLLLFLTF